MKLYQHCLCGIVGVSLFNLNLLSADTQSTQTVVATPAVSSPSIASQALPQVLPDSLSNSNLVWNSEMEATNAVVGENEAHLTFNFANVSSSRVTIINVHTSCGCTTAQLPPLPWVIEPSTTGQIGVTVNLLGKSGTITKTVTVDTDKGSTVLTVYIDIATPIVRVASVTNRLHIGQAGQGKQAGVAKALSKNQSSVLATALTLFDTNRVENFKIARTDRQAVFRNDCAICHVKLGEGKHGKELYSADCGICHDSKNRATMVPDLHHLNVPTNVDFWKTWISRGKPHSLMPAFAKTEGGPLTKSQITSLATYLATAFPSHTNQLQ